MLKVHLVVKASKGIVVEAYAFADVGEAEDKGDEMRNSRDFNEAEDDVDTIYDVPIKGFELRRCCVNCVHLESQEGEFTCSEGGFSEIGDPLKELTKEDCNGFYSRFTQL